MTTMLAEILACLVAVGLFSLFVGWMINAALTRNKIKVANAEWEQKYSDLDIRSRQETQSLEEQLQSLAGETRSLTASNHALNESLRKNEVSVHKARADAIEINRQQATTQERLQQIIQEKDNEITALKDRSLPSQQLASAAAVAGASSAAMAQVTQLRTDRLSGANSVDDIDSQIEALAARRKSLEHERKQLQQIADDEAQQTIALSKDDLPMELFDQTVRLDPASLPGGSAYNLGLGNLDDMIDTAANAAVVDSTADATAILDDGIEMDEATVALDDDALAFARSARSTSQASAAKIQATAAKIQASSTKTDDDKQ